ncbi:MAG: SIS domain-containing protein [Erysipelotrichaceae bacterium]|nr:SIS domain-containing protein [Erysipelotrichaceae bacterium]
MKYEYSEKIIAALERAEEANEQSLEQVIDAFVQCVKDDHLIHTFGTGHSHMIGIELFARAGGLGNVDAMLDPDVLTSNGAQRSCALEKVCGIADVIYDSYRIEKGDLMVISSNSGRNAMPIEMAMRAQKEGVRVIAVTDVSVSRASVSRHPSGKHLFECADLVLDTQLPPGDALLDFDGIRTGPGSSIVSMALLDIVASETIRRCLEEGIRPYVFQSQNVDGFDNDAIYAHYAGRIKHY